MEAREMTIQAKYKWNYIYVTCGFN